MKNLSKAKLLEQLRQDVCEIMNTLEDSFSPQEEKVLNFKPEKGKWSIAECLEHLNIASGYYVKAIQEKLTGQLPPSAQGYRPGRWGNYFVRVISPGPNGTIGNKMGTLKRFNPIDSALEGKKVLNDFSKQQESWLSLLEKAEETDMGKIRITSALGPWLRFKLGDAFRFAIGHNQRHILQALRVLESYQQMASQGQETN